MAWACGRAGYRLVARESAGANAFFVRDDVADTAGFTPTSLLLLYRPLVIASPRIGHPWWAEPDCPRLTDDEMARVRIVDAEIVARRPDADSRGTSIGIRAQTKTERRTSSRRSAQPRSTSRHTRSRRTERW